MTGELQKELLNSNIQVLNESNGKFVFYSPFVHTINGFVIELPVLFDRQIAVGSYFICYAKEPSHETRLEVFVCCNISMKRTQPPPYSKNNLFWYCLTDPNFVIIAGSQPPV